MAHYQQHKLYPLILISILLLAGCNNPSNEHSDKIKQNIHGDIQSYQPSPILAQTLPEIIQSLNKGELTSQALVQLYLARIARIDQSGPMLHSILQLNPNALTEAKKLDKMRANGNILGALHGIPILLKDNIETKDEMPTTAGSLALINNLTGRDSPLVKGLRSQGAIILGKTNLSQWANFRSESSMSGWSALGGQVRNPHMLDRNPCGSSSGSGAATAASLASASIGTETNGSVICPSNANGIVGFKPTVGIVPQDFIIPISASQDTAGPMTKSVMGAAIMMNAMAVTTPNIDYTKKLNDKALEGVRVGVLRFAQGSTAAILEHFNASLLNLQKAGAILIDITERPKMPTDYSSNAYDLLKYEFKHSINEYLASTSKEQVTTRNLKELIEFNKNNASVELSLFNQDIFESSEAMPEITDPKYSQIVQMVQKASREGGVDLLLQTNNVDVLVSPSGPIVPRIDPINGDVWPNDWPGIGGIAARAGYPHITVPMGEIEHLSVGLSFIGSKNQDANILGYAYAFEKLSQKRLTPQFLKNAEDIPRIQKAMSPFKK